MNSKPITQEYETLRSEIQEGATIAPIAKGIYGFGLRVGQMGPYGHVGIVRRIVVDGILRVMVVEESTGGGRYRPLSHYKDVELDVFAPPVDGRAASSKAVILIEGLATYDWRDIWRLARWGVVRGLLALFDGEPPRPPETEVNEGTKGLICSAFVTAAYVAAGWDKPDGHCAWPSAICAQLGEPVMRYRP